MTTVERIASLNDIARTALGVGGKLVQTSGISARPDQSNIREKVEKFNTFTPDNDPHGERDFGSFVQLDRVECAMASDWRQKPIEIGRANFPFNKRHIAYHEIPAVHMFHDLPQRGLRLPRRAYKLSRQCVLPGWYLVHS